MKRRIAMLAKEYRNIDAAKFIIQKALYDVVNCFDGYFVCIDMNDFAESKFFVYTKDGSLMGVYSNFLAVYYDIRISRDINANLEMDEYTRFYESCAVKNVLERTLPLHFPMFTRVDKVKELRNSQKQFLEKTINKTTKSFPASIFTYEDLVAEVLNDAVS